MRRFGLWMLIALALSPGVATAQFKKKEVDPAKAKEPAKSKEPTKSKESGKAKPGDSVEVGLNGPKFDKRQVHRWLVGIKIRAVDGPVGEISGTAPVPTDWPEQQVKIVNEDVSTHHWGLDYRTLDNGLKQLVFNVPMVPTGETAKLMLTMEITRSSMIGPADTTVFVIPKNPPKDVRRCLAASPYIETASPKIKAFVKETTAGKEDAWGQVEALYDGVRSKVKFEVNRIRDKGANAALKDGTADREDITSLFVACCRIHKVPARMVWVPDSCYAEFYLEDNQGKGYWFPCQVAGDKAFGSQPDTRPILQKGDSIRVPEKKEPQRFVTESLSVKGAGGGKPQVEFVRKLEMGMAPQ